MVIGERTYLLILAIVAGQRLVEVAISRRHARRAFAIGGIEAGRRHYNAMVLLHAAFLASCAAESIFIRRRVGPGLSSAALVTVLIAQALRYWTIWTLGARWNTRVIVTPMLPPVVAGPYKLIRHPNYLAVVMEIAALPLIRANWWTAAVFSIANAGLLWVRIPIEERAMGTLYGEAFATKRRFVPR
ncbi:MAG: hypothetical protein IVW54_11325 [Candidatus Binataceae bacterium]|nr:hypothetical protein [Candidatus Binataceae bacterium]